MINNSRSSTRRLWTPVSESDFVGRYRIGSELARGGTSTVHLGRLLGSVGFHRPVAIKRLHVQYARDPDFMAMLLDEARIVTQVRHPNIVPVIDVMMRHGEVFLIMEYVHGQALAELVVDGAPLEARLAAAVLIDALLGLDAAHKARTDQGEALNIIHRDVSPQNIMVGADGFSRLVDFGIAKAENRLQTTHTGQLKGKLSYMAPEQFYGGGVDCRADLWSASVVLWEMLTGQRLFRDESAAALTDAVLHRPIAPPSTIAGSPVALDAVVMGGLARDPARRFASAEAMAEALRMALPSAGHSAVGAWVRSAAAPWLADCMTKLARADDESRRDGTEEGSSVRTRLAALGVDPLTPPRPLEGGTNGSAGRMADVTSICRTRGW